MSFRPFIASSAALVVASVSSFAAPSPEQLEFFEKNIRPLFAEHCTDCHGPTKHENGLRLDVQAAVTRGSEYGPVIEPGKPASSKLIKAIKHQPGVEAMPKKGDPLTADQIALIEKWITAGAAWPEDRVATSTKPKWQEHWAFQPIKKPEVSASARQWDGATPVRNPIDGFVAAKLKEAGLKPAPATDPETLCRRIYLDMTGLKPSFEQQATFVKAYQQNPITSVQRLVTEMLSSPHYGERWARYWLDIARYSDTEGYMAGGKDIRFPYAYTYRDWVVSALNADMGYDRFLKLQLAADRMSAPDSPDLAALGFLTVNEYFLGDRTLQIDDRIDATARGMLGLTVGCARCHDHKYDPIPSADYYAMYSIFNSSDVPETLPVIGKPTSEVAFASYKAEVGKVETQKAAYRKELYDDLRKPDRLAAYLSFIHEADAKGLKDEAFRGRAGQLQLRDRAAQRFRSFITQVAAPASPHPAFVAWNEFAKLSDMDFAAKASEVIQRLAAPTSKSLPEVTNTFKDKPAPKSFAEVSTAYASLLLKHEQPTSPNDGIHELLMRKSSPMAVSVDEMEDFFTRKDREHTTKMDNEIKKIELVNPGAPPRAMVMNDKAKPADVHVFIRGNPARQGAAAPRANLTLLGGQKFTEGSGRLELANAIASKDNPLTARVIVNRVWMQHFGKPLVSSTSDFGVQAPKPEQLDLLNYLAATLIEQGWSLKKLHQEILTSATYQQSCATSPEKETKDAENFLLSRFNRTRLDYEAMRDCVVQATGVLNTGLMGGRSIPLTSANVDQARTVYHFVDRYDQATVPAMFDFANPDQHSPQRFVTTVPQQALFLMNSPFMQRQASTLSAMLPVQGSTPDAETVKALYRQVLQREPKIRELDLAQRFLNDAVDLQRGAGVSWKYGTQRLTRAVDGSVKLTDWKPFSVLKEPTKAPRWTHTHQFPDKQWHYAVVSNIGGHAPADDLVVTRRWQAPSDMTISISGEVFRDSEQGNGVRGLIIANESKLIAETMSTPAIKHAPLTVAKLAVKKGDILDFAISAENGDTNSDSFVWTPKISLVTPKGTELLTDAKLDFCGADAWPLNRAKPQTPLSQLAQALLISNEFMFAE